MDVVQVGALWLHAVGMVIVIGYYGVLGRIVLPALRRSLDAPSLAVAVPAVERRALPLVLIAIVVFIVTGVYLLMVSEQYTGIGDFSSTWSTMMLVKHLVILGMIALGIAVDRLARAVGDTPDEGQPQLLDVLSLASEATMVLGAIVLLLTAVAQVA